MSQQINFHNGLGPEGWALHLISPSRRAHHFKGDTASTAVSACGIKESSANLYPTSNPIRCKHCEKKLRVEIVNHER